MKARIKRIWVLLVEELALFSLEFLLVLVLGLAAMAVFIKLALLVMNHQVDALDQNIYGMINSFASDNFTIFMKSVTFFGNVQFITFPIVIILIYFLFIRPHRWYSIKIPVVAAGSITANVLLKNLFERPRPELTHMVHASGQSFPSGHAMCSFAVYGLMIYIVWYYMKAARSLKILLTILLASLILLIGISRIYLGVHFASDVVAGFSVGFIWLMVSIYTVKSIERMIARRAKPEPAPVIEDPAAVADPGPDPAQ
jgi:membrane-associated phospholipid phosphatase